MTEADLQTAVLGLAAWLGVLAYHTHDSRRSQSGWPDLALCGTRGMILRELKSAQGRPSKTQLEWGERLTLAGQDWDIWRPADLASGRIHSELQAIR